MQASSPLPEPPVRFTIMRVFLRSITRNSSAGRHYQIGLFALGIAPTEMSMEIDDREASTYNAGLLNMQHAARLEAPQVERLRFLGKSEPAAAIQVRRVMYW
jgi:hypothetical protein